MTTKATAIFEKLQLELKDSLESLDCIEVVSASSRNGDVRFLCRAYDEPKLLDVISEFLTKEGGTAAWYSFFGKKYFLHNGKLLYGWVVIFESEDLEATTTSVRTIFAEIAGKIEATAAAGPEVIEATLPWTSDYYAGKSEARVSGLKA